MARREARAGAALKQVSKFLAQILRHKPEAGSLKLDSEGWAQVEDVLVAVRGRFGAFDRDELEELVRTNDKKRYAFDETGGRIRASQGHSIGVEPCLAPGLAAALALSRHHPSLPRFDPRRRFDQG